MGAGQGDPVTAVPPTSAPSAVVRMAGDAQVCTVRRASGRDRVRGLVAVDPHPVGIVVVWLPGMNQHPCRAELTRGNADLARRIAKDVEAAPKWPSGVFHCPMDDALDAELYFEQPRHAKAELVDAGLAGCRGIAAPGRSARQFTDRFARDLASIAPSPWRTRL
ncbi:hypothetical protein GCM10023195_70350 [Actinoallomurus liliacearum]|uniref:Uncharacterized protein n=1 Tax=Actinoallomurus liliacearum TaxID=1080073 RepID=A0ABP8TXB0_9ACTN